eukprot:jgi/Mesvir1/947/Mv17501-RA.1
MMHSIIAVEPAVSAAKVSFLGTSLGKTTRPRPLHCAPIKPNFGKRGCVTRAAKADEMVGREQREKASGPNQLEALATISKIVADTGEFQVLEKYRPTDATTNPSLILKAAGLPAYADLVAKSLARHVDTGRADSARPMAGVVDELCCDFGEQILKIVPGRVSTECDAHLSYNTQDCIDKALRLIELYDKRGIGPERVYIKIASTWEGIRACEVLQKQGISCNMTLLFSFAQAMACADAGASLVSPFVGRILDWYKKKEGREYSAEEDPGVLSVRRAYNYYKQNKYDTVVMAASFRNKGEILALAGCDNITISPALLEELKTSTDPVYRMLRPDTARSRDKKERLTMESFYSRHNEDAMAVDLLKSGIAKFAADQAELEKLLLNMRNK